MKIDCRKIAEKLWQHCEDNNWGNSGSMLSYADFERIISGQETKIMHKTISNKDATTSEEELIAVYQNLRLATIELEKFLEKYFKTNDLTEVEYHRLDKSVVIQKVGFKLVKKILKDRGFKGLKAEAMALDASK